jgi:hypothetical protein
VSDLALFLLACVLLTAATVLAFVLIGVLVVATASLFP